MDKPNRRAAIRDYKERKAAAGIYALRCAAADAVWVGVSRNIDAQENSVGFALRMGSHPNRDLQAAMRGESLATAKYQLFAAQARSVGQSRVANLFDGTSAVEFREHMSREAMYAGLVGSTATNLSTAAAREDYQGTVTYPQAAATATSEGATAAASLFTSMATDELALRDSFLAVR